MEAIKRNVLVLFLGLGCVVWFSSFSLGLIKVLLMLLIISSHFNLLFRKTLYVNILYFVLIIFLVSITFLREPFSKSSEILLLYYNYFENYFFYILGYYYVSNNNINNSFLKGIIYIITPFCFFTLLNFTLGIPNWHAPNIEEHYNDMNKMGLKAELVTLSSSGFGLGRTGWATTLLQYLPLCLAFRGRSSSLLIGIICFITIILSILVSGSKGGMLYSVILITIIICKLGLKGKIIFLSLLFIIVSFLFVNIDTFLDFFRLNSVDVTTGRGDQYKLIPLFYSMIRPFGIGVNGSSELMEAFGLNYSFHNVYLRILIDYGWFIGCLVIIFTFHLLTRIVKTLFLVNLRENRLMIISSLVLLSGILSGLTEPGAVFEARNWWVIWWFFLGIFTYQYKLRIR